MNQLAARVLVIDDFAPWRDFVAEKLRENHNLRVIGVASDGLEAVQKAEELQPDLVLLDIGLPRLNGIEVAKRLRKVAPAARVLFVSGDFCTDIIGEGLRIGALGYVHKPKVGSELLPAIQAVLGDIVSGSALAAN